MSKKAILIFLLVAALFTTFTQTALAYPTVKTTGNGGDHAGYGPYQSGTGGEFTLQASADLQWVLNYYKPSTMNLGGTQYTFQTFCVEENEYINPNTTYNVTMNDGAIRGGSSGATTTTTIGTNNFATDPISNGTAWLYYNFAQGTLSGYNYETGRKTSAAALQNTIWWLEGEADDPGVTNIFRNALLAKYTSDEAIADNNGKIPVKVLNLWALNRVGSTCDGDRGQDQLVVTGIYAPVPAAIWLFGAGLAGLMGVRRKFTA